MNIATYALNTFSGFARKSLTNLAENQITHGQLQKNFSEKANHVRKVRNILHFSEYTVYTLITKAGESLMMTSASSGSLQNKNLAILT